MTHSMPPLPPDPVDPSSLAFASRDRGVVVDALYIASRRAESRAAWDVALATARAAGHTAAAAEIEESGLCPSQSPALSAGDGKQLVVCAGEEPWIQPLLAKIGSRLQQFLNSLAHARSNVVPQLKYGSDCSGVDSPAVALKSILLGLGKQPSAVQAWVLYLCFDF